MELKSYLDFEAAISPLLKRIKPEDRQRVLAEMYRLAADRAQGEVMRSLSIEGAESYKKTPAQLKRKRAHIKHAIEELSAADSICPIHVDAFAVDQAGPKPSFVRFPIPGDLGNTIEQLETVNQALQEIEDVFRATISPPLKTVGLNVTASDYRFIHGLAKLLSRVGCREVNKVISQTFDAAFGESYDLQRVTTVRKRLARRTNSGRGQGQTR
jgi:hypothetical protein